MKNKSPKFVFLYLTLMPICLLFYAVLVSIFFNWAEKNWGFPEVSSTINYDELSVYTMVLIGPLFEEVIFRGNLKFNKLYFCSSIGILAYSACKQIFSMTGILLFSMVAIIFIIGILTVVYFSKHIKIFYKNNQQVIYHCLTLLFALAHITNFSGMGLGNSTISCIIIYLPASYTLAYARCNFRYTLFNSLFIHMFVNFSSFCIIKIGMMQ